MGLIRKEDLHESLLNSLNNPNLLINGDFRFWRRGNNFTTSNSYIYTADRWMINDGTVNKCDFGIKIQRSDNSKEVNFQQFVEDIQILKGKTLTLSWESKINKSMDIKCFIFSFTSDNIPVELVDKIETYDSSLNIQKHSITFKIPEDLNTTCSNLCIRLIRTTSEAELSIELGNIKLEIGDHPTEFVPRPYGEELTLCQRYFKIIDNNIAIPLAYYYDLNDKRIFDFYLSLSTPLRINPTVKTDVGTNVMMKDLLNDKKVNVDSITILGVASFRNTASYLNIRTSIPLDTNVKIVTLFPSGGNAYLDAEIY